jgi:tight adherence protein C
MLAAVAYRARRGLSVDALSLPAWILLAAGGFALGVFGVRGWLDVLAAFRDVELERLDGHSNWQVSRAFAGFVAGIPVWIACGSLDAGRWLAALLVAALAFAAMPRFVAAARERVEQEMRDELPLHLDLIALAMEGGATLPAAIALCAEHAPDGRLRRAWNRVLLEIHAGADPLEALRALEERVGFRLFGNLAAALRSSEKFGIAAAAILREKARHCAGMRFSRAERLARAAPLKLWATLMLCLVPCTLVVLAFPVARMLALVSGG